MLSFAKDEKPPSKCYFAHGTLQTFVDESQPPHRRKPFSSIREAKWSHTVDLIIPAELLQTIQTQLEGKQARFLKYAKVIMSLRELVEGDFFTNYVKKGNIMMLSEGRPGTDNKYSLCEGTLRIELDKITYERAGLVGKPIPDGGIKHKRNRFAIELDLRQPSMVRGKKGFERILWAFKNVLVDSLTWLFHDLQTSEGEKSGPDPMDKHHPHHTTATPTTTELPNTVIAPLFPPKISPSSISTPQNDTFFADKDFQADLEEYLSLLAISSPRIRSGDNPDPFICRYSLPDPSGGTDPASLESTPAVQDLMRLRWHGFLPSSFALRLLLALKKTVEGDKKTDTAEEEDTAGSGEEESVKAWGAMMMHGFADEHVTLLIRQGEFLEWRHQARL